MELCQMKQNVEGTLRLVCILGGWEGGGGGGLTTRTST